MQFTVSRNADESRNLYRFQSLYSIIYDSTKDAFEHAAISNMISGLSTRNIEESACEAVLIESVSNPSTLISMVRYKKSTMFCIHYAYYS